MAAELRARDLLGVPCLLSAARVPLAAMFPLAVAVAPSAGFAILVAGGLTDVVDGWYARRYAQVTTMGAVLDPITDKIFVATVVVTLIVLGRLELALVPLLGAREIVELPLVLWLAVSPRRRRARAENPTANVPGKLATALQFVCVSAALFGASASSVTVGSITTAVIGALAAALYWRTFLRQGRSVAFTP